MGHKNHRHRFLAGAVIAALAFGACANDDETRHSVLESAQVAAAQVAVASVTASGSGCPQGTWTQQPSSDGKSVTIKFDAYKGSRGGKSPISSKSCRVSIALEGKDGVSYAAETIQLRGDSQGSVGYRTQVSWASAPDEKKSFFESRSGKIENVSLAGDLWSGCGGEQVLQVDSDAEVAPNGSDFTVFEESITLTAKRCEHDASEAAGSKGDAPAQDPAPTPPTDPSSEEQPKVSINNVTASGSGCPAGAVTVMPGANGEVSLSFTGYAATIVPATPRYSTKACGVSLRVKAPDGYVAAIESVGVRGTSNLPSQVRVSIQAEPGVVGRDAGEANVASVPPGINKQVASTGDFSLQESFTGNALVFGGCGLENTFQLNTRLAIDRGASPTSGTAAIQGLGPVKLVVRKCP